MSLIEQTSARKDFDLALITALAFIAVDSSLPTFWPAYLFATDLSAPKKLARFAACQFFWNEIVPPTARRSFAEEVEVEEEEDIERAEVDDLVDEQDEPLSYTEADNQTANDTFRRWVYDYLTTE
ncbi:hypothetical protein EK21DRAFT_113324 [Setomelanomma holmii]|uniref:Uncharacterized protein n=1 Tax=Setomelanomma holmii TaxID=210430 RepID=A0A9P4LKU3_9PLEO|nr:hypothetical protein EK21DRAFT_113324 [Setomelanomma holmii]